jgi:hypothetical protein
VAAIDALSFRHIAIVADLRLAGRALPRLQRRAPRDAITVIRPLNHPTDSATCWPRHAREITSILRPRCPFSER